MNKLFDALVARYVDEWKHGHVDIDDLSENITVDDLEKIMTDFRLFVDVDIKSVRESVEILSAQCGIPRIRTPNKRRILNFLDSVTGERVDN